MILKTRGLAPWTNLLSQKSKLVRAWSFAHGANEVELQILAPPLEESMFKSNQLNIAAWNSNLEKKQTSDMSHPYSKQ